MRPDSFSGQGTLVCSPFYTDVLVVTFSYTVDTQDDDSESILRSIHQVEERSLTWLGEVLLPCEIRQLAVIQPIRPKDKIPAKDKSNGKFKKLKPLSKRNVSGEDAVSLKKTAKGIARKFFKLMLSQLEHLNRHGHLVWDNENHYRLDWRPKFLFSSDYDYIVSEDNADLFNRLLRKTRFLNSRPELGIVGFGSLPSDDISLVRDCFPTYRKTDVCTVVHGQITTYLKPVNPTSADVSLEQKESVQRVVRYEVMKLMRSGVLDNDFEMLDHVRYLSPVVVMGVDLQSSGIDSSSPITQKEDGPSPQNSNSSGLSISQSILIITAAVTVIGAAAIFLATRLLLKRDEGFFRSGKKSRERNECVRMAPQLSERGGQSPSISSCDSACEHLSSDAVVYSIAKSENKAANDSEELVDSCDSIRGQIQLGGITTSLDVGDIDSRKRDIERKGGGRRESKADGTPNAEITGVAFPIGGDWETSSSIAITMRRTVEKKRHIGRRCPGPTYVNYRQWNSPPLSIISETSAEEEESSLFRDI